MCLVVIPFSSFALPHEKGGSRAGRSRGRAPRHRHESYRERTRNPIVILADNVDKASNTSGILRAADAFLAEKVLVNRPDPDVFGAMGAQHWQPVEWNADLMAAIELYCARGYTVVALVAAP